MTDLRAKSWRCGAGGALVALSAGLMTLMTGCGKKPGNPCIRQQTPDCTDSKTMVKCEAGRWVAFPCGGPRGCDATTSWWAHCDQMIARSGEACRPSGLYRDPVVLACSTDAKALLICKDNTFGPVTQCNGPKGCRVGVREDLLDCDIDTAKVGDSCITPTTVKACSSDHQSVLFCDAKTERWSTGIACPGAACLGGTCTKDYAREGDPCALGAFEMCAEDGRAKLLCKDEKRSVVVPCDGPRGCEAATAVPYTPMFCDQKTGVR